MVVCKNHCGTPGCIAGHMAHYISLKDPHYFEICKDVYTELDIKFNNIAEWFGFTLTEKHIHWYDAYVIELFPAYPILEFEVSAPDPTKVIALNVLNHLNKTKEIDWKNSLEEENG